MTETITFGDLRCEPTADTLTIRPGAAWVIKTSCLMLFGHVVLAGATAACYFGFDHWRQEGPQWAAWLCAGVGLLLALVTIAVTTAYWAVFKLGRPLSLERNADAIRRGNTVVGRLSDVLRVAVERRPNDADEDILLHFKDAGLEPYQTGMGSMTGEQHGRLAILLAKFMSVPAVGYEGNILWEPPRPFSETASVRG